VSEPLVLSPRVRDALVRGAGVVALETSVIGQGLPHPRNLECAKRMSKAIVDAGAIPAWIGVIEGAVRVGLDQDELDRIAYPGAAVKVARRDLPAVVGSGAFGATTVSATIWAAASAGIHVGATGGIGGVHPGRNADVSADLLELARTPGLLVCSGPKSIVDPSATAERLEELGVVLVGFRTGRMPFFLTRETSVELEHRVEDAGQAADMLRAAGALGTRSTIVLCNPIPELVAMDEDAVAEAVAYAERRLGDAGVRGKARTPMLLEGLAEATQGRSLEANLALLEDNARIAGNVATAFAGA
jgi:pseudouridine-5'-phosphate glycosidase